jgi:hypothetical protein
MNPIVRNILSVILAIIIGSAVNMAIIMISSSIIPPPEGTDITTTEGLKAAMQLMEPKHFLMPFLAHALGTLVGAILVVRLVVNHQMKFAIGMGCYFLIGGITAVIMFASPLWYSATDLILAYLPMGYLGGKIGMKWKK